MKAQHKYFLEALLTRFDLIKPPLIKDRIIDQQVKSVSNYKGRRSVIFKEGQYVFIRDYTNVNKNSWTPAIIKEKNGPRSYQCTLSNKRIIKRHTDQIRAGVTEIQNHNNDCVSQHLSSSSHKNTTSLTVEQCHENNDSLVLNDKNINESNSQQETENETVNSNINEFENNSNLNENISNEIQRKDENIRVL